MHDQAADLRTLMRKAARQAPPFSPVPRLVVFTGAKNRVGTTTMAVNASIALAQQGVRVVLVDANLEHADVARYCGLQARASIGDLLAGRRDIHEVLQRGPGGIQIAPGGRTPHNLVSLTEAAHHRLIDQLRHLGRFADQVVIDAGGGSSDAIARFWESAEDVIVVGSADSGGVMEAYATIKTMHASNSSAEISLAVSGADARGASDAFDRIAKSCQRFLDIDVRLLGNVPYDDQAPIAGRAGLPLVIRSPQSEASQSIDQLMEELISNQQQSKEPIRTAA